MTALLFHPSAAEELNESIGFYEHREHGLGLDLEREVLHGMLRIQQAPHRWAKHTHGTRAYLLQRFPFRVIYIELPDAMWIVAIAHCARKPGYWKKRLKDTP